MKFYIDVLLTIQRYLTSVRYSRLKRCNIKRKILRLLDIFVNADENVDQLVLR